ncbi:MAG: tetratricopeptide repeat protein [Candidatus Omnitrophica bacterium]|nr:tetratricopeptide repeat protein [Candidatus Omnitrophota bacterium]
MPQPRNRSVPVIFFYLIVALALFFTINSRKVAEHAWPKTLSRLRVDYSALVRASGGGEPERPQLIDSKRYFNAVNSIYGQRSDADAFLGVTHFYLGDRNSARAAFLRLEAKESGFFWAKYDLAVLAFQEKNYPAALDYCQQALQLPTERSVTFMMTSKVYQPLFVENGITPQKLAQNIEQARLLLLQMLITIKAGVPESFGGQLLVRVF